VRKFLRVTGTERGQRLSSVSDFIFVSAETKLKYFHGNEFVAVTFAKTLESSLNYSSIVDF
jgi:hypothetical protein